MRHKFALTIALAGFTGGHRVWRRHGRRRSTPGTAPGASSAASVATAVPTGQAARLRQRGRRRRRRAGRPRRPRLRERPRTRARRPPPQPPAKRKRRRRRPAPERRRPQTGGKSLETRPKRRRQRRRAGSRTTIASARGAGSSSGAVTAPSANGRRPAQPAQGPDGGSQFNQGGAPTVANPTTTIAPFGPAPIGVPNFVIDSLRDPALPAADLPGLRHRVRDPLGGARLDQQNRDRLRHQPQRLQRRRGRLDAVPPLELGRRTALDANGDGRKDPYNPVDAICAAAHYLKAAGGDEDLYKAIFAYNHADWYVQEVLLYATRLRQAPVRPGRLADRPDRGRPLPDRRRRPLRRRHLRPGGAEAARPRRATNTATPPR